MTLKLIGAVLILAGCGGCGFAMAAAQRREERNLRLLVRGLEYMECELQFHQTPLPQLCRMTAGIVDGSVRAVFLELALELDKQLEPDPGSCMQKVLGRIVGLSDRVQEILGCLSRTMGCFDLPGQLRGLAAAKAACGEGIEALSVNRESRLRSYQTLGICAGAALAILFL